MDLTSFGPYAFNVRTNISSYGPRARLIRGYYYLLLSSIHRVYYAALKMFKTYDLTFVYSNDDEDETIYLKALAVKLLGIELFTKRHKLAHKGGFKTLKHFVVVKINQIFVKP